MNEDFEKGARVVLLDRPMGPPSKIQGVIVGEVGQDCYNILLTNGMNQGTIIAYNSYQLIREKDVTREIREDKERKPSDNKTLQ